MNTINRGGIALNTIVNKLLDVDKEARLILDEAQQYYDKTIEEIDKEKQAMQVAYIAKGDAHIEQLRSAEQQNTEDSIAGIQKKYAVLTQQIEDSYNQNHLSWETALFEKCVGR